jgi:acetyl esterase/lipase
MRVATASTNSQSSSKRKRIQELWAHRGFSPTDLLNLWKPNGAWEQYDGLAYGEKPRQKFDVYKPRHAAKAPVLVFFYGGSWQGGSRDLYPFVGASLAAQGIVTIVPDYSIFPPARFPTFVEDAARAVRFARANATQWGGDPARLVLMGHSAGAYLGAMLSFDPQWLRRVGLNSKTDLAAFVGLAGPYDFLPIESRILRTIFGGANRAETQPISFVTGEEAPSLLITARRDRLVSPGNSRRMAAKIQAHGGVAEERTYGGVGHFTLIGAIAPGLRVLAPVLRDVTQFVWRVTRRQTSHGQKSMKGVAGRSGPPYVMAESVPEATDDHGVTKVTN